VRKFYWLVVSTAFSHAPDIAQAILFVAFIALGAIAAFVPRIKDMIDIGGWQIAAIVFGSIIAVRLVLAPYWIWEEQNKRIDSLKGDFSPNIRANIDLKIRALSPTTKSELYRLADGSIGFHQLSNEAEIELGKAALVIPKYAHDPAKCNEHWPLIKQWLKQNSQ